jgi:hypothetical protein
MKRMFTVLALVLFATAAHAAAQSSLVINELMADNETFLQDPAPAVNLSIRVECT